MADAEDNQAGEFVAEDEFDDAFANEEYETLLETPGDAEAATSVMKRETAAKIFKQHPECIIDYQETVYPAVPLASVPPINDDKHTTYPFLNKFEKTKILGFRMNQLSQGARPFIVVPEHVKDIREIARMELEQKRLPFIIKRPLPDGTYEYWRLQDLLQLD